MASVTMRLRVCSQALVLGSGLLGISGNSWQIEKICISYGRRMISHHVKEGSGRGKSRRELWRLKAGTHSRV